jgi:hypothetical protein
MYDCKERLVWKWGLVEGYITTTAVEHDKTAVRWPMFIWLSQSKLCKLDGNTEEEMLASCCLSSCFLLLCVTLLLFSNSWKKRCNWSSMVCVSVNLNQSSLVWGREAARPWVHGQHPGWSSHGCAHGQNTFLARSPETLLGCTNINPQINTKPRCKWALLWSLRIPPNHLWLLEGGHNNLASDWFL